MRAESEIDLIAFTAVMPGQIPGGRRLDGDVSGERALLLADSAAAGQRTNKTGGVICA